MDFNYCKLKGKIKEVCGTQQDFAKRCNINNSTLSFKLNNKSEWTQEEIVEAASILGIPVCDIPTYFFTH